MLHVLNGDATRLKLERSGVGGTLTVWADALHEGPVPAGLDDEELMRLRAAHFAALMGEPEETVLAMINGWHAGLARVRDFGEVVFWLEHDLFDQLILLRHLHWLSTASSSGTRFSLICIGSFPGVSGFSGLGPLTPEQLATLLPDRTPITPGQLALGREGWSLFRAADPRALLEWAQCDLPGLPFVQGALRRHFEDYPSVVNGLSRSERQILSALREGERTFPDLFVACQHMEERVFMGDTIFAAILRGLANGRNPLVRLSNGAANAAPQTLRVAPTDLGAVVLEGGADHVELNGIDRWMGGVHLTAAHGWRWDGEAAVLTLAES
jgi:hypothetical protein